MATRRPVYGLDLIRLLAALLVTIYHFAYRAFHDLPGPFRLDQRTAAPPAWWSASWLGWVGVQVFFVISGLVIAYSAGGNTGWRFFAGRVARLFPAMLIAASVCAATDIAVFDMAVTKVALLWLRSITFFPVGPWISAQIWTLPVEIAFYTLVFAMIVAGRGDRLEPLAWVLGVISALYWLASAGLGIADPIARITQLTLAQHGCYFALGMMFAAADSRGLTRARAALMLLCLVTAVPQIREAAGAERVGMLAADWPVAVAVFLVAVAAIAASMVWKRAIDEAVGDGALARTLRTLGLMTYPLYLVHMQVGGVGYGVAVRAGASMGGAVVAALVLALVVALVIATLAEPPVHAVVKALLARIRGLAGVPAVQHDAGRAARQAR